MFAAAEMCLTSTTLRERTAVCSTVARQVLTLIFAVVFLRRLSDRQVTPRVADFFSLHWTSVYIPGWFTRVASDTCHNLKRSS